MSAPPKYKGTLFLLPCPISEEDFKMVIPEEVVKKVQEFRFFAVEDLKSARRFLRRMDRTFPIDDSTFFILNKKTPADQLEKMIEPLLNGENVAIISEAGCPGIADPGAALVDVAHNHNIPVQPLVGPSSILLALMGSGFNGQSFTFHGYLPKERKDRIRAIKDFEFNTLKTGHTNLFMDTPFRNMNVLDDLLNELNNNTSLCIASHLTGLNEKVQTKTVVDWREHAYDLGKIPTIFAIGKGQSGK
jgi:16S rRNA (cytidine1402-2'-O)-methyltransferase|tara:strand:+ start:14279 stop:15016 length:738 start_codon:yes stop_codon:yes gene_type:complete